MRKLTSKARHAPIRASRPANPHRSRQAHSAGEATMRPGDAHRASKISRRASKLGLAHAPLTDLPPAPAELGWSASLPLGGTGTRPSDSSSACDHSSHGCWVGARSNYVTRPTDSALLRSSNPNAPAGGFPAAQSSARSHLAARWLGTDHRPKGLPGPRPLTRSDAAQTAHNSHISPPLARSHARFLLRPSLTCSLAM